MAIRQLKKIVQQLLRAGVPADATDPSDGKLVARFVAQRDEDAFAELVHRYGPMVMGVCKRLLSHNADAEDAFQATFLVLVRKASSIADRTLLANWLYGVARRTALEARRMIAKRQAREKQGNDVPEPATDGQNPWSDLRPILDEELSRLPEKYRLPIVLCDLQGDKQETAAKQLGWPMGTFAGRLAKARTLLARRLTRRGVTLSSAALGAVLSEKAASATVAASLAAATVRAAIVHLAERAAVTGVISANVLTLMEGVMKTMLFHRLKNLFTVAAVFGIVAIVCGILIAQQWNANQDNPQQPVLVEQKPDPEKKKFAEPNAANQKFVLKGRAAINAIAFSPDGKTLATAYRDTTIKLWDVATSALKNRLIGHRIWLSGVAFSRDGKLLASCGYEVVIVWDGHTGKKIATIEDRNQKARSHAVSVSFSPDGRFLASAWITQGVVARDRREEIKLWDVSTRKITATLPGGPFRSDRSVAFSSDGMTLAAPGKNIVRLWDVRTWKSKGCLMGGGNSVTFHPNGKLLVSIDDNKGIQLWDVRTRQLRRTLEKSKGFDTGLVEFGAGLALSSDGSILAAATSGVVKLWNISTGKIIASFDEQPHIISSLSFGPDDKTLAVGVNSPRQANRSVSGEIKILDVKTLRVQRSLKEDAPFSGEVRSVAFSPDGKMFASAGFQSIHLWDAHKRKVKATHNTSAMVLAFSPNNKILASADRWGSKSATLWDVGTRKHLHVLLQQKNLFPWDLSFSPDGATLAIANGDLSLVDVQTGKVKSTLCKASRRSADRHNPVAVCFSPKGKLLASGGMLKDIRLWDVQTSKVIATLKGHKHHVRSVVINPDGKSLASASTDQTVLLWDINTHKQIASLKTHRAPPEPDRAFGGNGICLAFSPDGKTLATGSWDTTIKQWDARIGKEKCTLIGHAAGVLSVAFSTDGKTLVSGSGDHTIRFWDVSAHTK